MADIKRATTYEEQLDILERRGIVIDDENKCKEILENVNYSDTISLYHLAFPKDREERLRK